MRKKILASMMVLGLLVNGFIVQAAEQRSCDHTNIHSFDTTRITEDYYHWHDLDGDNLDDWCHATTKVTFTTYVCSDCGTVVDIIDKPTIYIHAMQ